MSRSALPRGVAWVLIATVVTVVPACQATAGGEKGPLGQRIYNRFAYRPAYPGPNPIPRTRPLYLSGYAGAQYGPRRVVVPGPGLAPTTVYQPVPAVPYWTPTAPGWLGLFGPEPGLFQR